MKDRPELNGDARETCREIEQFMIDTARAPSAAAVPVLNAGEQLRANRLLLHAASEQIRLSLRKSLQMAFTPEDHLSINTLAAAEKALLIFLGRAPKSGPVVKSKKKPQQEPEPKESDGEQA